MSNNISSENSSPQGIQDMGDMGKLYDREAPSFIPRAPELLWWKFIGIPAFDRHVSEFYGRNDVQLLDLGTGGGRVIQHLIENGIPPENMTGIEKSGDQVKKAKQLIDQATFEQGDIAKFRLPPKTYNLVTSCMVFEFLTPKELQQTLENAYQALKPGGTLFYVTTHPDKMQADSGLEEPGVFTVKFPWGGEGPNYYRTKQDFIQATQAAGFDTKVIEDLSIPPEAKKADPEEYQRYAQYPHIRLAVKAHKPAA